ncbi:alpha/beta fold hydrolase [Rhizobium sp. CAU 1783]
MEHHFSDRVERGTIRSGAFSLSYQIEGEGPSLLVIGSSLYYARTFSPALRRSLRLYFVDHRCFATADGAVEPGDFAFDTIIADIERARIAFGLERFAILGHSGHGYMALEYARRHPERVTHVVMVATGPNQSAAMAALADRRFEERAPPERKAVFTRDMGRLGTDMAARPNERFKHLLIRLGARSWFDAAFDASPLWQDVVVNDIGFDHLWGEVFRDLDMHALARAVKAPVLLALGSHDYLIAPPEAWRPFKHDFAALTVRMFDRSAHTPQFEESDRFDATLLSFLED